MVDNIDCTGCLQTKQKLQICNQALTLVKCILNADLFITLVRMRTKSAIADLYGSTEDRALRPSCHWAGDVDF